MVETNRTSNPVMFAQEQIKQRPKIVLILVAAIDRLKFVRRFRRLFSLFAVETFERNKMDQIY